MSTTLNAQKLIGYAVAGGILLVLADVAPQIAIPTTGLILLTVALSHANQLSTLSAWISQATGTSPASHANPPLVNLPGGRPIL